MMTVRTVKKRNVKCQEAGPWSLFPLKRRFWYIIIPPPLLNTALKTDNVVETCLSKGMFTYAHVHDRLFTDSNFYNIYCTVKLPIMGIVRVIRENSFANCDNQCRRSRAVITATLLVVGRWLFVDACVTFRRNMYDFRTSVFGLCVCIIAQLLCVVFFFFYVCTIHANFVLFVLSLAHGRKLGTITRARELCQ